MSDHILYKSESLTSVSGELKALTGVMDDVAAALSRVDTSAEWWAKVNVRTSQGRSDARSAVRGVGTRVGRTGDSVSDLRVDVGRMQTLFDNAEAKVAKAADRLSTGTGIEQGTSKKTSFFARFAKEFSSLFGLDQLLAGAGDVNKFYKLFQEFNDSDSPLDFFRFAVDAYQLIEGSYNKARNYMRIGRAVGGAKAFQWWAKSVTGLKPLGRASSAKNLKTRFFNNFTNKTSPFNAQIKEVTGDFLGRNGVGKAVTKWAGVLLDGVVNFIDNRQEQAASGGKMSDQRVIEETVTETAVGTVLNYGTSIVVGAAVTTVLGTTAAPAVLVVAITGLVTAGINAGCKALTGESLTEVISDGILDLKDKIVTGAKEAGKAIGKTISRWFPRLSFA